MKKLVIALGAVLAFTSSALADDVGNFIADLSAMAAAMPRTVALADEDWAMDAALGYATGDKWDASGSGTALGIGGAFKLNDTVQLNAAASSPTGEFGDIWSGRVGLRISSKVQKSIK